MRNILILLLALVALSGNVVGQSEKPPTAEELAEIAMRGQALAEYDQAAWHSSDAVEALHPDMAIVQRYVARKTSAGWIVAWGHFDETRSHFLIAYEAKQGANPAEYTVTRRDPAIEDADFYFHAASALETARKDFYSSARPAGPYNISVLPAKTGDWYVYAIPGQQDSAVLPYGGDVRYTISSDGGKILDRRQMHKGVIKDRLTESGERQAFNFHSHFLSDLPEDSDIFYAITRKAAQGEWVATRKYTYEISSDFSLGYLGKTSQIAELLGKGDCRSIGAHYKDLCADKASAVRLRTLSALWMVTGLFQQAWPLTPSATFKNARCKDGQIWLTLTVSLRNDGDTDLILSSAVAGNWIQARFADNPVDLISDKYEKLVFVAVDPKYDPLKDDSFVPLSPGKELENSKEVFLAGLDPKGKSVVQFLIFPWFPGDEKPPKQVFDQFAKSGTVYTEPVLTEPLPFTLDPKLVETCKK